MGDPEPKFFPSEDHAGRINGLPLALAFRPGAGSVQTVQVLWADGLGQKKISCFFPSPLYSRSMLLRGRGAEAGGAPGPKKVSRKNSEPA
jgi:hypothetical protein